MKPQSERNPKSPETRQSCFVDLDAFECLERSGGVTVDTQVKFIKQITAYLKNALDQVNTNEHRELWNRPTWSRFSLRTVQTSKVGPLRLEALTYTTLFWMGLATFSRKQEKAPSRNQQKAPASLCFFLQKNTCWRWMEAISSSIASIIAMRRTCTRLILPHVVACCLSCKKLLLLCFKVLYTMIIHNIRNVRFELCFYCGSKEPPALLLTNRRTNTDNIFWSEKRQYFKRNDQSDTASSKKLIALLWLIIWKESCLCLHEKKPMTSPRRRAIWSSARSC